MRPDQTLRAAELAARQQELEDEISIALKEREVAKLEATVENIRNGITSVRKDRFSFTQTDRVMLVIGVVCVTGIIIAFLLG